MYDRERGVWESQPSGRVIKIVSISDGFANVDVDGNGVADTGAALTALSITDAERQQLAILYLAGQSLWRVLVSHFSPGDLNWAPIEPPGAISPDQDPGRYSRTCVRDRRLHHRVRGQILGEARRRGHAQQLPERSGSGRKTAYTVEIP
jgi:hypothetical protein